MSHTLHTPMSPRHPGSKRPLIAAIVVLLHVGLLWALQSGLMQRTIEIIVPAEVLAEFLNQPAPPAPQLQAPKPPQPVVKQEVKPVVIKTPTPPTPVPTPEPAPALAQPTPPTPAPTVEATNVAPAIATPPPRIELPSSDAAHLNNPTSPYPTLSKRFGEQGTVIVHVLIGTDGYVREIELKRSSGYDRLDQTALRDVRKWRFVPGKRNGVPEAMWFDQPYRFVLTQ